MRGGASSSRCSAARRRHGRSLRARSSASEWGALACCRGWEKRPGNTSARRGVGRGGKRDGRRAEDLVIDFRWGAGDPGLCGFTQKS